MGKERNTVGHIRVRGQRSKSDTYREREQQEADQRTFMISIQTLSPRSTADDNGQIA